MKNEHEIRSVRDYLSLIKEYDRRTSGDGVDEGFLFRGQAIDSPLVPKILRLEPKDDLLKVERLLLQEFKRDNPLLIEPHRSIDDWDYLTLGQHFGLPTRLLDWSDNALTALWFATDTIVSEKTAQTSAIVWVLMADTTDYIRETAGEVPFDLMDTKLFRPRIIKQRINNQSGVFSVHSTVALQRGEGLEDSAPYADKLLKIRIPKACFSEIRTDLYMLGVHAFSIFPEMEGLCAFLQWKFFK